MSTTLHTHKQHLPLALGLSPGSLEVVLTPGVRGTIEEGIVEQVGTMKQDAAIRWIKDEVKTIHREIKDIRVDEIYGNALYVSITTKYPEDPTGLLDVTRSFVIGPRGGVSLVGFIGFGKSKHWGEGSITGRRAIYHS